MSTQRPEETKTPLSPSALPRWACRGMTAVALLLWTTTSARASDSETTTFRRGLLAVPYVGVGVPFGDSSDSWESGLRLGGFLGGHVNPLISLNGELAFDFSTLKGSSTSTDVDVTFSPFFHVGARQLEVFFGPKLGFFTLRSSGKVGDLSLDVSGHGVAYGFNLGAAIPLGRVAFGGLVSVTSREFTTACASGFGPETCSADPDIDGVRQLSFSLVAMF